MDSSNSPLRSQFGWPPGAPAAAEASGVRRFLPPLLCAFIFAGDVLLHRQIEGDVAIGVLYLVPLLMSLWVRQPRSALPIFQLSAALLLGALPLVLGLRGRSWWNLWDPVAFDLLVDRVIAVFALWVARELAFSRLEIESRLVAEREFTRTTLDSIGDAVVATDEHGKVRFLNPPAEALLGIARDQAVGRPLNEVVPLSTRRNPSDFALKLERSTNTQWIRRAEVAELPVDASRAPIVGPQGEERGEVLVLRDISERVRYAEAMRRMAYRDELTGLPNRNSLGDRLALELAHARRHKERLAVLFIDLDGFKPINDRFGHHAGDAMLKAVAEALRGALREGDTIARLGGDEFTVVLPRLRERADAEHVAHKILEALREPLLFEGNLLRCSASIGIALFPEDAESPEELLRASDEAMYAAKQQRDAVRFRATDAPRPDAAAASARPAPDAAALG